MLKEHTRVPGDILIESTWQESLTFQAERDIRILHTNRQRIYQLYVSICCTFCEYGRLAQLDRVQASEAWGRGFESHAARQLQ